MPDDKLIDAIRNLLVALIDQFGPWGTIGLIGLFLLGLWLRSVYLHRREDKAIQRALEEKERTVQRLANQERTWRRLFLIKFMALPPEEADRLLQLEGDYRNAVESRAAVEPKQE